MKLLTPLIPYDKWENHSENNYGPKSKQTFIPYEEWKNFIEKEE